ncbi:MAG TPA: hypothetical protein VD966_14395 [Pyrinomonadaceae bacterium]|nr:hypothetical protein [Pyrinomonadaceae bacterium]
MPALCALHGDLDALANAGSLRRGNRRETLVLGLLAGLAPLGLILQTLVVKEDLLAGGPDEIFSAVNTPDRVILEFHLPLTPFSI